eukprot:TRINITY_DN3396_c0_g1_i1.p1 TRINITY_DN3396_c0_g1~~TRINITY_DN3396_c0_g1_i1.p1  ORF type:complete len:224 (-),score=36.06 TRINITY_DN3396_c0_g1_i1:22-693(-)
MAQKTPDIILVCISSAVCPSAALYYQRYRSMVPWRGSAQPAAVASLIQVFMQFSRELDTGEIDGVVFQHSLPPAAHHVASPQRSRSGTDGSTRAAQAIDQSLSLVCERNADAIVAFFHSTDSDASAVKRLARHTLAQFSAAFSGPLAELQPELTALASVDKIPESTAQRILSHFLTFEALPASVAQPLSSDAVPVATVPPTLPPPQSASESAEAAPASGASPS